jgi:hypothetical protein
MSTHIRAFMTTIWNANMLKQVTFAVDVKTVICRYRKRKLDGSSIKTYSQTAEEG